MLCIVQIQNYAHHLCNAKHSMLARVTLFHSRPMQVPIEMEAGNVMVLKDSIYLRFEET